MFQSCKIAWKKVFLLNPKTPKILNAMLFGRVLDMLGLLQSVLGMAKSSPWIWRRPGESIDDHAADMPVPLPDHSGASSHASTSWELTAMCCNNIAKLHSIQTTSPNCGAIKSMSAVSYRSLENWPIKPFCSKVTNYRLWSTPPA